MYLCEVAIVSQLCIFFPYVLHGLCENYLTCDIAFNAVMPPSRASTRGRYSRIEGVTGPNPSHRNIAKLVPRVHNYALEIPWAQGEGHIKDMLTIWRQTY